MAATHSSGTQHPAFTPHLLSLLLPCPAGTQHRCCSRHSVHTCVLCTAVPHTRTAHCTPHSTRAVLSCHGTVTPCHWGELLCAASLQTPHPGQNSGQCISKCPPGSCPPQGTESWGAIPDPTWAGTLPTSTSPPVWSCWAWSGWEGTLSCDVLAARPILFPGSTLEQNAGLFPRK